MNGITDLNDLLQSLNPSTCDEEFVFLCRSHFDTPDDIQQHAVATVWEKEGLTLVVPKHVADRSEKIDSIAFRRITLQVNSSLEAVGLTAAVAQQLTHLNIPANVIAGFHHDHIFVPTSKLEQAMDALQGLANS
ncbi:MAG: ACT domain-containing protein [Fuerstiella sp.]